MGRKFDGNYCCEPQYRCYPGPNRAVSIDDGLTWTDVNTGDPVQEAVLTDVDCTLVEIIEIAERIEEERAAAGQTP